MMTACPSCVIHGNLPATRGRGDVWVSSCPTCGHELLEARALEVIEARSDRPLMLAVDPGHDLEHEAGRLAEAASLTAERYREQRRQRRATQRGWAILAAAVFVPLAFAVGFPETVARTAPAAARIYGIAGIEVNVVGFTIRNAASELQMDSGVPLLAVTGEVVNVADTPQQAPALRFILRDGSGGETYAWTLDGVGARKLDPGEATGFLTRVAAPPPHVREVEIRFADGG